MSKWVIVQSFDAAKDCEAERAEKVGLADKSGTYWYYDTKKRENVGAPADLAYRCVATDDPRLKEK